MVSGGYFNKGVKSLDSPHVGHVVRETSDKIVVFGEGMIDMIFQKTRSDLRQPMC